MPDKPKESAKEEKAPRGLIDRLEKGTKKKIRPGKDKDLPDLDSIR